jgi:hypothetical protein
MLFSLSTGWNTGLRDSGAINEYRRIAMTTSPKVLAVLPAENDAEFLAEFLPVSAQIEHFLSGDTTGRALFEALYNHVLDEPVPPQLKAMLPR